MRTGFIILTVIVIALAISNPGEEQFRNFVSDRAELAIQEETGDSMLGRALSGAGASVAGEFAERVTDRENYYVFSTYTIDLGDASSDPEEWKFLGIAGQFVELERPDGR